MMLLMTYAQEKGILKSKAATVIEVRDNGADVTLIYKVEGQKYSNGQYSAKTLSKEIANGVEVDEKTGRIMSGSIVRKNNFWVWSPSSECEEA